MRRVISRSPLPIVRLRGRDLALIALCVQLPLLRLMLSETLGGSLPHVTGWMGVMLAAWFGGFLPGAIVAAVGLAVGQYVMAANGVAPLDAWGALLYTLFALLLATLGETHLHIMARREADRRLLADMSARLQQVARLNAMGELAGTLAHELNQPVTAIASYADAAAWTLKQKSAPAENAVEQMDKIIGQTRRIGAILKRIREQVTGEALDLTPQSLSAMVREAIELVEPMEERRSFAVRYAFEKAADLVLADHIQVQQVLVNLVRNGLEAMEDSVQRELRIGARAAGAAMTECWVADAGSGISADVLPHLFEPFATSKPQGTGIGLAVCRTIIEGHGGRIWAEPAPGGGAVFRFTLPRATAEDLK